MQFPSRAFERATFRVCMSNSLNPEALWRCAPLLSLGTGMSVRVPRRSSATLKELLSFCSRLVKVVTIDFICRCICFILTVAFVNSTLKRFTSESPLVLDSGSSSDLRENNVIKSENRLRTYPVYMHKLHKFASFEQIFQFLSFSNSQIPHKCQKKVTTRCPLNE